MASEKFNCKECHLFFDSAKSLEVHIQYHPSNLFNMWMPENEDRSRDTVTSASSPVQHDMSSIINSDNVVNGSNVNSVSPFPAPSPMQYDYNNKISPGMPSPGMQSPPVATVPQGPPSGHNIVGFPQQSPSGYYPEYNQPIQQQQIHHQYTGYQTVNYMNGYEDNFYNRGSQTNNGRFHPYSGRSPIPTPSPSGLMDIKEERKAPESSDILDLDSQKVLSNGIQHHQNPTQNPTVTPMWRPHETFQQTSQPTMPSVSLSGLPNMHSATPYNTHMSNQTIHHLPPMSSTSNGFSNNGGSIIGGSYHNQSFGLSSQSLNPPAPGSFGAPATSPSPRDQPPTEFAPNVKRPKNFKCEDCNKWFTSQGHLKRHYNTTLHKNMSKQTEANAAAVAAGTSLGSSTADNLERSPIKSIGNSSLTPSHEEESNLSNAETANLPSAAGFSSTPSAFQPTGYNFVNFQQSQPQEHQLQGNLQPSGYHPVSSVSESLEIPHTTSYQPTQSAFQQPLYNISQYQQHQGGLHGPGFHQLNEIPGPEQALDGYNYKMESLDRLYNGSSTGTDRPNLGLSIMPDKLHDDKTHINAIDGLISPTERLGTEHNHGLLNLNDIKVESGVTSLPNDITVPSPGGDTGSEASLDSSESCGGINTDGSHQCIDCGKKFNKACYLTQHRTTYHEGERPYKCTICGKRFTDETSFQDHQAKHAGDKPYKCGVCPKQFNHKTDLRRHMCLHTGEKPFSCEQCGKGFIRKDHMLKHFQTHRKKAMQTANAQQPPPAPPPPLVPPSLVHAPGFAVHQVHPGHPQHVPHAPMNHPSHVAARGHSVHTPAVY